MKICHICKIEKLSDQFNKNGSRKDGLQSRCKECDRTIVKENYHLKYKNLHMQRTANRRKEYRQWLIELKQKLQCEKCGDNRHYVLDFHHIENKEDCIANLIMRGFSKQKIEEEINKCKILCANCHRELHFLEKAALV